MTTFCLFYQRFNVHFPSATSLTTRETMSVNVCSVTWSDPTGCLHLQLHLSPLDLSNLLLPQPMLNTSISYSMSSLFQYSHTPYIHPNGSPMGYLTTSYSTLFGYGVPSFSTSPSSSGGSDLSSG